jgi:exodeoxyribonuclease VII large subunit
VSPLATLDRGYAIVTDAGGTVLQDAALVQPGDRITARLAHGRVAAEALSVERGEPGAPETDQ